MAETKKYTEAELEKAREILAAAEREQAEARMKEELEAIKPKRFKAGVWVCVQDCFHGGRLYKAGDKVSWQKAKEAPVDAGGYVLNFQPEA